MSAEKKKKNHMKTWILLYAAALVILYLVIYAFPTVTGVLTPTTVVSYGELKVWDETTCYFVRNEQVYTAEKGGAANYYVQEGTMTRRGTKVLDVNPTSGGAIKGYTSDANGVISYYIDGNESYFTPETMASLTEDGAKTHGENPKNTMRQSVLAGEPLYKRVDNSTWYAVFWVDQREVAKYEKNASITMELPLGSVTGTIYDLVDNGDQWLIMLKFNRYYEDLTKIRSVDATVITQDYKGLLVPNESLITVDKKLGVYVKQIDGDYKFTPVKVITTDGESSLVYDSYYYEEREDGTSEKIPSIESYDEILKSGQP